MATSKTIQPTNVTVQIPAMTDVPDQSVNSNCIDKAIDAINTLHSKISTQDLGSKSLSGLQTALETLGSSLGNNEFRFIRFYNESNSAPGFVANMAYEGKIFKYATGRYDVELTGAGTAGNEIKGIYNSGWSWDAVALTSQIKGLQSGQVSDISLAANSQTEVTVSLPTNYAGGTYYTAVATLEFYGTANLLSPVLIRDKSANSFVCRIYNGAGTAATGVKLNWFTMAL